MTAAQVLLAVGLPLAAAGLVLYARYRASPAAVWRRQVFARADDLQARREALRRAGAGTEAKVAALADEAFRRHLQTVPVERLADFPGIGPATIGKVKDAGYARLADLERLNFDALPDVGPARAASLRDATAALLTDARSRFAAGACPEAQEFRKRADALRAADGEAAAARGRELAGIDDALGELLDRLPLARAASFAGYLLRRPVVGLTLEVMARPLPEGKPVALPPDPSPAPPLGGEGLVRSPSPPRGGVGEGSRTPPPADVFLAELNAPARAADPSAVSPVLARLRAVVRLGVAVAKADGRVTQAERKAIRAYLDGAFGHDPAARHIDPAIEQAAKANPDPAAAIEAVKAAVPAADWPKLVEWAGRVADASGDRSPKEVDALAKIAQGLGVMEQTPPPNPLPQGERGDRTKPAPSSSPPLVGEGPGEGFQANDPRAVLDIPPDAPLDAGLVRRKYRQLVDKLDPAKAAAFGPEFAHLAERKRAAVRAAAEALLAPLGEPLELPAEPPPPADIRHNPDLDDVFGG